jgi:hypothetical protein
LGNARQACLAHAIGEAVMARIGIHAALALSKRLADTAIEFLKRRCKVLEACIAQGRHDCVKNQPFQQFNVLSWQLAQSVKRGLLFRAMNPASPGRHDDDDAPSRRERQSDRERRERITVSAGIDEEAAVGESVTADARPFAAAELASRRDVIEIGDLSSGGETARNAQSELRSRT